MTMDSMHGIDRSDTGIYSEGYEAPVLQNGIGSSVENFIRSVSRSEDKSKMRADEIKSFEDFVNSGLSFEEFRRLRTKRRHGDSRSDGTNQNSETTMSVSRSGDKSKMRAHEIKSFEDFVNSGLSFEEFRRLKKIEKDKKKVKERTRTKRRHGDSRSDGTNQNSETTILSKTDKENGDQESRYNLLDGKRELQKFLKVKACQGNTFYNKYFPSSIIQHTKSKPVIKYSVNAEKATNHFQSRQQMFATLVPEIEAIVHEFFSSMRPKKLKENLTDNLNYVDEKPLATMCDENIYPFNGWWPKLSFIVTEVKEDINVEVDDDDALVNKFTASKQIKKSVSLNDTAEELFDRSIIQSLSSTNKTLRKKKKSCKKSKKTKRKKSKKKSDKNKCNKKPEDEKYYKAYNVEIKKRQFDSAEPKQKKRKWKHEKKEYNSNEENDSAVKIVSSEQKYLDSINSQNARIDLFNNKRSVAEINNSENCRMNDGKTLQKKNKSCWDEQVTDDIIVESQSIVDEGKVITTEMSDYTTKKLKSISSLSKVDRFSEEQYQPYEKTSINYVNDSTEYNYYSESWYNEYGQQYSYVPKYSELKTIEHELSPVDYSIYENYNPDYDHQSDFYDCDYNGYNGGVYDNQWKSIDNTDQLATIPKADEALSSIHDMVVKTGKSDSDCCDEQFGQQYQHFLHNNQNPINYSVNDSTEYNYYSESWYNEYEGQQYPYIPKYSELKTIERDQLSPVDYSIYENFNPDYDYNGYNCGDYDNQWKSIDTTDELITIPKADEALSSIHDMVVKTGKSDSDCCDEQFGQQYQHFLHNKENTIKYSVADPVLNNITEINVGVPEESPKENYSDTDQGSNEIIFIPPRERTYSVKFIDKGNKLYCSSDNYLAYFSIADDCVVHIYKYLTNRDKFVGKFRHGFKVYRDLEIKNFFLDGKVFCNDDNDVESGSDGINNNDNSLAVIEFEIAERDNENNDQRVIEKKYDYGKESEQNSIHIEDIFRLNQRPLKILSKEKNLSKLPVLAVLPVKVCNMKSVKHP